MPGMVQSMAQTSQPRFIANLVSGFGSVTARHGFAVNLVAVAALAAVGVAFVSGRRRVVRPALAAVGVLCLADWVLVEGHTVSCHHRARASADGRMDTAPPRPVSS